MTILSVAVVGCFSSRQPDTRCDEVSEYQSSTTVPAIVIPDGLTAPPESGSFAIPPGPQAADQKSDQAGVPGAACLARPPDYFRKEAMPAS